MAEKIIILSDGTGNAASSVWRTNVWRVFQTLELQIPDQVARYDDGVGTSAFLPLALFGGAFGWGLKRNILDAYKFVSRNYEDGAKIYLFGFSRGAFTVRVLAGFILDQGLVKCTSESELHDLARKAYRAYRASRYNTIWRIEVIFRAIRDALVSVLDLLRRRQSYDQKKNVAVPTIEFIGVWDTVAAYGLPISEMTRGVSTWIWPLELPNRVLSGRVNYARHALALDDERTTFHPVLWTEKITPDEKPPAIPKSIHKEKLVQVWFVGMHANVGGGYPDDALAFVPLNWLLSEARNCGLHFKVEPDADPDSFKWVASSQDKEGRLYDSRSGLGAYYRYGPRNIQELCSDHAVGVSVPTPKIHKSVFDRIASGANAYAPIGIPANYVTITDEGNVVPPGQNSFETDDQAQAREELQKRLWNYVWLRRLAYFATLGASLHLVAFWVFHNQNPRHEYDTNFRLISESVRFTESFLPRPVHWWTDWYAGNPEWFAGGVIALIVLMAIGTSLSASIQDSMRIIWESRGSKNPLPNNRFHNIIYSLRSKPAYKWLVQFGRRYALPTLFVVAFVWFTVSIGSHTIFNVADAMGAFCHRNSTQVKVNLGIRQPALQEFKTNDLCSATGLTVRTGYKYEITITITKPWLDGNIPTSPEGFNTDTRPFPSRLNFYGAIFLRRVIFRPWFRLIARIGETGVDEYFLTPWKASGGDNEARQVYKARFDARRDGELFLYVNDAVLAFPWVNDYFFRNNKGTAKIEVRLL